MRVKVYGMMSLKGKVNVLENTDQKFIDYNLIHLNPIMNIKYDAQYKYRSKVSLPTNDCIGGTGFKILGSHLNIFNDNEIDFIVSYVFTLDSREDKRKIIELSNKIQILNSFSETIKHKLEGIWLEIEKVKIEEFTFKKDLTAKLKKQLSKEELFRFNAIEKKLAIFNEITIASAAGHYYDNYRWVLEGVEGVKKHKKFQDEFLKDPEFLQIAVNFYKEPLVAEYMKQDLSKQLQEFEDLLSQLAI